MQKEQLTKETQMSNAQKRVLGSMVASLSCVVSRVTLRIQFSNLVLTQCFNRPKGTCKYFFFYLIPYILCLYLIVMSSYHVTSQKYSTANAFQLCLGTYRVALGIQVIKSVCQKGKGTCQATTHQVQTTVAIMTHISFLIDGIEMFHI